MAYAILRFAKINSKGGLSAMQGHWDRSRPTENVDPKLTSQNRLLHGGSPYSEIEQRLPKKRRKDAVICVEGLLSASPEYFRSKDPSKFGDYEPTKLEAWTKASLKWLQKEFGERLVSAALHLDEATPHIHAAIIPLDKASGRLNAKAQFEKGELRRFQTEYAKAVTHLGIKRGIEGSTASHQKVKRFYGAVNGAEPPIELTAVEKLGLAGGRVPDSVKIWQDRAADALMVREENEKLKAALRRETEARAAAKKETKTFSARLREIPLEEVLPLLGYEKASDTNEWDGPAGRLRTAENEFFLEVSRQKGRGAIDLVKALTGFPYEDTIAWLGRYLNEEAAIAEAAADSETKAREVIDLMRGHEFPQINLLKKPEDLEEGGKYLSKFGLTTKSIPSIFKSEAIGAAQFADQVKIAFPLREGSRLALNAPAIGYAVRSTDPTQDEQYVVGNKGVWHLPIIVNSAGTREIIALTEKPQEALALLAVARLRKGIVPALEDPTASMQLYVATGSSREQIAGVIGRAKATGAELVLAYGLDMVGREMTEFAANEANKQELSVSIVTWTLALAGQAITDFALFWLQIMQEGVDAFADQIKAARARRSAQAEEVRRHPTVQSDIREMND